MPIQATETAGTVEITAVAKGAAAVGAATGAQVIEATTSAGSVLSNFFAFTPANLVSWLAAIFVFCQLSEWWWKRMWRPLFEHFGWLKPKAHKAEDAEE